MISGREISIERQRGEDLNVRHARLHSELVQQFEETALEENHGIIYLLIGWQHWLACIIANFLLDVLPGQRWLHLLPWPLLAVAALVTIRCLREPADTASSPLGKHVARLGLVFGLLAVSAMAFTILTPSTPLLLALLSTFFLAALGLVVTRRFQKAAWLMAGAAAACALAPTFGFAIYGCSWVVILQSLGLELVRKRRLWIVEEQYRNHVLPFTRLGS